MGKKWSIEKLEDKLNTNTITFGKTTVKLKNLTGKELVEEIKGFFIDNKMTDTYIINDGNNHELNVDTVIGKGGVAFPLTVVQANKPS